MLHSFKIILILQFVCVNLFAQELIVNGSADTDTRFIQTMDTPDGWFVPQGDEDYVFIQNSQASTITPRKGNGVAGVAVAKKGKFKKGSHIGVNLNSALEGGKEYCLCFDVALHRSNKTAVNNLGVKLYSIYPDVVDHTLDPDVKVHGDGYSTNMRWQRHCVQYRARGGEQYLVFGAFGEGEAKSLSDLKIDRLKDRDQFSPYSFYYIDDVSMMSDVECGCSDELKDPEKGDQHVAFVLDISGSMREGGVYDALKENLKAWISGMDPKDKVDLIAFSSNVRTVYSGTVQYLRSDSIDKLLPENTLRGGTNINKGIDYAYKEYLKDSSDYMIKDLILISDGQFSLNSRSQEAITNAYKEHHLPLHFIHIVDHKRDRLKLEVEGMFYTNTSRESFESLMNELASEPVSTAYCEEPLDPFEFKPKKYLLVLDYSGSMRGKVDRLFSQTRYLLSVMPDTSELVIVSFHTASRELFHGKVNTLTDDKVHQILDPGKVSGGTDASKGIGSIYDKAFEVRDTNYLNMIWMISDVHHYDIEKSMEKQVNWNTDKRYAENSFSYVHTKSFSKKTKYYSYNYQLDEFSPSTQYQLNAEPFGTASKKPYSYFNQEYCAEPHRPFKSDQARKIMRDIGRYMLTAVIVTGAILLDGGN